MRWVAIVTAVPGELLLGGRRDHVSSSFERELDAQNWADAVQRTNESMNRKVESAVVYPEEGAPQILAEEILDERQVH